MKSNTAVESIRQSKSQMEEWKNLNVLGLGGKDFDITRSLPTSTPEFAISHGIHQNSLRATAERLTCIAYPGSITITVCHIA